MALSLAACGGKETPNNPPQSQSGENKGGTDTKDINVNNWKEVVAANYGLDIVLPEGWSVDRANCTGNGLIRMAFNVGGEATYKQFAEAVCEEVKKDATGDIKSTANEVITSFDEIYNGTITAFKTTVGSGKNLQASVLELGNQVELELSIW